MPLPSFNFQLLALANQLPDLPEGPSLQNVRGPVDASGYSLTQVSLALLALALIGGLFIWLYRKSRQQPEPVPDAKHTALAELDAATQASDDDRYVLLCANAIRRFLAARYKLPTHSQTTAELTRALPLDSEKISQIRGLLNRCDGVKFAAQALSKEERIELSDTAKTLIQTIDETEAAET